ncbi:MAG: homoserine O-succinyltransferase [Ruminococcaceae bacterium]|nr:homoserine O-succinyltransferase [Oscillospiraceae bacterium]
MPIKIPDSLPAAKRLEQENIFVMTENRALHQDIRPLKIAIVNIMPTKIETETQLLRLLGNSPLQVEVELIQMASHVSKNTSAEHLLKFYKTFDEIKDQRFDGLIITGAPVEKLPFEEVTYWNELCEIMDWAKKNVYSTLYICWGSQAGLYHKYGLQKRELPKKLVGIYPHFPTDLHHPLTRGFDDVFYAPHSRYTEVPIEDIRKIDELMILAESELAGAYIITDRDCRNVFISGHAEYSRETIAGEYTRDVDKGINPEIPYNYFENDDPTTRPNFLWKSHASMLYANWLNHIVYMHTPYDLSEL